jgi:hypothetical protein
VIAILLSLLVPILADAKLNARAIRSSSNLRAHAGVFSAYAVDYRDAMPYVTDPAAQYSILRAGEYRVVAVYFEAVNLWNVALADDYYAVPHSHEMFAFPGVPIFSRTAYNYSQAFLADPAYWRDTTRVGPGQWRATRASEVTYPSHKSLLVDSASEQVRRPDPNAVGGSPIGVAFVDGSVRNVPVTRFRRGYSQATGWSWHGCFNSVLRFGMHTVGGVRGRDVD